MEVAKIQWRFMTLVLQLNTCFGHVNWMTIFLNRWSSKRRRQPKKSVNQKKQWHHNWVTAIVLLILTNRRKTAYHQGYTFSSDRPCWVSFWNDSFRRTNLPNKTIVEVHYFVLFVTRTSCFEFSGQMAILLIS